MSKAVKVSGVNAFSDPANRKSAGAPSLRSKGGAPNADRNTIVPGHDDTTFDGFGGNTDVKPSFSGDNIVFYGKGQLPGKNNKSTNGIYARIHEPPIPAASTWGLIVLSLLLLTTGIVLLRRRPGLGRDRSAM